MAGRRARTPALTARLTARCRFPRSFGFHGPPAPCGPLARPTEGIEWGARRVGRGIPMERYFAVALPAAFVLSGCLSPVASGGCDSGVHRCIGNTLQVCESTGAAEPSWQTIEACHSPQVCRVNAAGPDTQLGAPSENGCFDPDAYCHGGAVSCSQLFGGDPDLWSCVLRASDQTFRWTRTICSAQVPKAMCFEDPGTPAACFEIVAICTGSNSHCEGNVLFTCPTVPIIIDGKAVFDWDTLDCAPGGQVCRVVTQGGASCVAP